MWSEEELISTDMHPFQWIGISYQSDDLRSDLPTASASVSRSSDSRRHPRAKDDKMIFLLNMTEPWSGQ